MFVAVRRGPASIVAKCLQLPSASSIPSSNVTRSLKHPHFLLRLSSVPALRALSTASSWRQEAAAQASQYNRTGGAVDDGSTQKAPRAEAQYGPVTRFAELGERNMVSPTIVRTITQDMKLETMTHVQVLTINETLKGIDVYA